MAPEPLVSPVIRGRRRQDDFDLSELKKKLLLENGDMDNKIPPSYSLEENRAVQRNYPLITKPSDVCSIGLQLKMVPNLEHIFGITTDCKIGISQVLNGGMNREKEQDSKYPAKIQLSSSLDVPLHCVPWFVGKGRPLKSSYNTEHGHAETIMHALGVQRALMLCDGTGSSSPNAAMVNLWLDSGASCHVIGNKEILSNCYDPPAGGKLLKVADGFEHKVESIGTIDTLGFRIPNVRFIRRFENLISVGQLAEDHNICSYLDKTSCILILWVGQEGTLVGEGIKDKRNGLYWLTFLLVP